MLLTKLKEATKSAHSKTEQNLGAKRIFSEYYSLEEYKTHLEHLYFAHLITESLLFEEEFKKYLFSNTLRSKDLEKDLKNITTDFISKKVNKINTLTILPFEFKIGIAYVLGGSLLGGNIIAKQLVNHISKFNLPHQHFYSLDQENVLENWPLWCKRMNELNFNEDQIQNAIEGALFGFDIFNNPMNYAEFE
jgi:heme oxygenase